MLLKNVILNNIDYIRENLQIVTISFKGVSFGNKKISLDELFLSMTEKGNSINKINKYIDVFIGASEVKRITNSIRNKLYKFRDNELIKTDDREFIILKKNKQEFCSELDRLIDTLRKETYESIIKVDYRKALINNIVDVIKFIKHIKKGSEDIKEITTNFVNDKTKDMEINIDQYCKFYDISEDLLRDNKFCETLIKSLTKKGEKKLINVLLEIEEYNILCKKTMKML